MPSARVTPGGALWEPSRWSPEDDARLRELVALAAAGGAPEHTVHLSVHLAGGIETRWSQRGAS